VCGAVQPGPSIISPARHCTTFDFDLDPAAQYFGFQRACIDRFASSRARKACPGLPPPERGLRDLEGPVEARRLSAEPLGHGGFTACGTINDRELLMEQMEKREALAEATAPEQIAKLAMEAESEVIACQCHISAAINAANLEEAGHLTIRLKYLAKLAEEARAKKTRAMRLP
jgi:molecular chaperone HscB